MASRPPPPGTSATLRSALGNGDRKRSAFRRAQEPGAGPGYADRNRVVARRIERAEHVASGHDGHVVLGRAAAKQQCDAQSFGHVVVSRIGPFAGDFAERGGIGQPAPMSALTQTKETRPTRVGATPSAVRSEDALGVIDCGPAANGLDPLDGLRYTEVKKAGDW